MVFAAPVPVTGTLQVPRSIGSPGATTPVAPVAAVPFSVPACCGRGTRLLAVAVGVEPIALDPALDLHARLTHDARDRGDVALVLAKQPVELIAAAQILGGQRAAVVLVVRRDGDDAGTGFTLG